MSFTGNRGEWSELYVLLRLLSDLELRPGDSNYNPIKGIAYPILKIIRQHSIGASNYEVRNKTIHIESNGIQKKINTSEFRAMADILLKEINDAKSSNGSFSITALDSFLSKIQSHSLSALSSNKEDIRIVIHDPKTGFKPEQGFSIKSQLGNNSTLFNASQSSNFIFEIVNSKFTKSDINQINSMTRQVRGKDKVDLSRRIEAIKNSGGSFLFNKCLKDVFRNNLMLIDSEFPKILAHILKNYYFDGIQDMKSHCNILNNENPLNYDLSSGHPFYEFKIKNFLTDAALGMTAARVWDGVYSATGGYIIIRTDGKIVSYHIYERNFFQDYLFGRTKLDTPSTSRNNFGKLYIENQKLFFNLNFQVRFF